MIDCTFIRGRRYPPRRLLGPNKGLATYLTFRRAAICRFIVSPDFLLPGAGKRLEWAASRRASSNPWAIVYQYWGISRQHIVRVLAGRSSPAFSLVSEFRPVRGCVWKCPAVLPCCRRRCRQTATCVRAAEWALAGVLPGLGSGMVRGPYAGPATRAGRVPARNVHEWPPGLARRGPRPGEVGKARGAPRPVHQACAPANSPPSPRRRPGARRAGASGFLRASGAPLRASARPGRWPARGGGAESGPGGRPCRARPASAGRLDQVKKL